MNNPFEVWVDEGDDTLYRFGTFSTRWDAYECAERCYDFAPIVQIHEVEHL